MPIGKKSGKLKSPLYQGGSTPAGLPSSADNQKSGTVGPSGLGASKSPPAGQLAAPKRKKGDLVSPSKAMPDTSKSKGSGGSRVKD
jgi:hypothetical protein|tara:strand:- start:2928 stop:3185 length:258 start_codon:yes stop_codon:yes gene_type:complete